MIDYFMALNPVIKFLMAFTACGLLSLIYIGADHIMNPPKKRYIITLEEHEIDYLYDDYTMVEIVVEEIIKQVKKQGHISPDKRQNNLSVESKESA